MYHQIETTVLGGLPVTVEFETEWNYGNWSVENIRFIQVNGRNCKDDRWIDRRLIQSGEMVYLEEKLADLVSEY